MRLLQGLGAAAGGKGGSRGAPSGPGESEQSRTRAQVWGPVLCQLPCVAWGPQKGLGESRPQPEAGGPALFLWRTGAMAWPLLPGRGPGPAGSSTRGVPSVSSEDAAVKGRLVECKLRGPLVSVKSAISQEPEYMLYFQFLALLPCHPPLCPVLKHRSLKHGQATCLLSRR